MGARQFHFGKNDPVRPRGRPSNQRPLSDDFDFADAEIRILARAVERREARMASDDYMDPFNDFVPVDFG